MTTVEREVGVAWETGTVAVDARLTPLAGPVPEHLLYFTAWVDAGGTLHFWRTVYGRDRAACAWLGCNAEAS